jgi:hypothetical protein
MRRYYKILIFQVSKMSEADAHATLQEHIETVGGLSLLK